MLKQRAIFFFWIPLALSWFLMTFEHPWVQGVIGRLPDAKLQLAAFGLIVSLMIMIESPIIMMLGTSAALSRDRQSFRLLWRYLLIVNALVTVVALAMGFTPLLDLWLGRVVGVQPHIIDAVRPGIQIMFFWPALIGFRRFYQGVMIRHNHTRPIGYGTIIRLTASAGVAIALGALTNMPGAAVGAAAMVASAGSELVYVLIVGRRDVQTVLETEPKPGRDLLTYRGAFAFHLPLALTSFMTLLVRPVIERGLAFAPDAEAALAAWAVVFSILLIARSGGMAYQEVVIALGDTPQRTEALRRYALTMGGILTGLLALMAFTPLITLYLERGLSTPDEIQSMIILGTQVGIAIPLLTALQSYFRGLLMRTDTTRPIYGAMTLSFVVTALTMWIGIQFPVNGVLVGSLGLALGYMAEIVVLWRAVSTNGERLTMMYARAAAGD